jgi:hypothetical protein
MPARGQPWSLAAVGTLLGLGLATTGCQFTVSIGPCGGACQKGPPAGGVAPLNARPQWGVGGCAQPDVPPPGWVPPPPGSTMPPANGTSGLRPVPPGTPVRGPDLPPMRAPGPDVTPAASEGS